MVTTKQMNIKNRTFYFFNNLINLKDFDPKLLKSDKKYFNDISIYYIGCVTKNLNTILTVYILFIYLLVNEMALLKKKKVINKYLNISITDSNNEVFEKYGEVWSGVKGKIKKINNNQVGEYGKDYVKIKFNSDDDLPLNTMLKFCILAIIIRTI